MPAITVYSRVDCHLCDVALGELERLRIAHGFDLHVIDLDRDAPPEKRAAYDCEVPVIELDGRKIMKYQVDEARLVRLLSLAAE